MRDGGSLTLEQEAGLFLPNARILPLAPVALPSQSVPCTKWKKSSGGEKKKKAACDLRA